MTYRYPDAIREDILRLVPEDGKVIGSIGCGTAATEAVLVQRGREVHGVDVSPEAVDVARMRLTSARLVKPDNLEPFPRASLDGLILADVIEHLPAAWDALQQFAFALKPGGWAIISVPNMLYLEALFTIIWKRDWPEQEIGIFDRTHQQFMTRRRLIRWCGGAQLSIEHWADRYDPNGPRRYRISRLLDVLSLGLLHEFCAYQLLVRCRRI